MKLSSVRKPNKRLIDTVVLMVLTKTVTSASQATMLKTPLV
jgi:hypothetical protein